MVTIGFLMILSVGILSGITQPNIKSTLKVVAIASIGMVGVALVFANGCAK